MNIVTASMLSFECKLSAYFVGPYASEEERKMEGGGDDRGGGKLHTLQDFLAGNAPYVSVAMDIPAFPYGTMLCIPILDQKYKKQIVFRVVDSGDAFKGKGRTRADVCVSNRTESYDTALNCSVMAVALGMEVKRGTA